MNFGSAFVGVAAGAVPPPASLSVVVVSVVVASVDVVSVAVELDVSGVVVVMVVTTVELPVVIVVTIVVVACAWNGAAPAVNAAAAAPSVISTANEAPHTAYFLYCLLIPPPCFLDYEEAYPSGEYLFQLERRQMLDVAGKRPSQLFNGLQIRARPGDPAALDAQDDHPAELEHRAAPRGPVDPPFAPDRVAVLNRVRNLDTEVGNVADHLRPELAQLFTVALR